MQINGTVDSNGALQSGTHTTTIDEQGASSGNLDVAGQVSVANGLLTIIGLQYFLSSCGTNGCFFQLDTLSLVLCAVIVSALLTSNSAGSVAFMRSIQRVSMLGLVGTVSRGMGLTRWVHTPLGATEFMQTPSGASPTGATSASATQSETIPIAGGFMLCARSAGDRFAHPPRVWESITSSDFEDDFAATAFDADSWSTTFGADFSPWDNWVFGVADGYENTDIDTTFNFGSAHVTTYSVVAYIGVLISDKVGVDSDLSFDLSAGYSRVDIDQFRALVAGGARITSSTNSERFFFSGNVNAGQGYGALYLSGTVGLLVARDEVDGFTESNGTVIAANRSGFGQISVGGEAS